MSNDAVLQQWSAKSGKSVADLQKMIEKNVADLRKLYPTMAQEVVNQRARAMLYGDLKKDLISPAIPFEGIVLGLGEPFDFAAGQVAKALKAYKENPQAAYDAGLVNQQGQPVYVKGYSKGQPLPEHSWLRNCFGVAKPMEGAILPFNLTLSGDRADPASPLSKIDLGTPYSFRANVKEVKTVYTLNDSSISKFVPTSSALPDAITMIDQYCASMKVNLGELNAWHDANKLNPARVAIVEGDVVSVDLNVSDRSHRIVIDDETLGFEDEKGQINTGITVWIPKFLGTQLDFGPGSRAIVIGGTTPTQGFNYKTGKPDPETIRMSINAMGLWPRPEFKIPLAESGVKAQELS